MSINSFGRDESSEHETSEREESAPLQLEALEPLDLKKCETVSDIVDGMSRCSFGARMLGEVARTLTESVQSGKSTTLVYDGKPGTTLTNLLDNMVYEGMFDAIMTPAEYAERGDNRQVTVVGRFSERDEDAVFQKPDRAIFINGEELAKPGQIRDGYFPDAVFADPQFAVPLLYTVLAERLHGKQFTVRDLVWALREYPGLATQVHQGAHTFRAMVEDKECETFLTLSGAMTVAQMYHVIDDMIADDMVQSVTSTGALMAHGLMPGMGLKHYKHDPLHDDILLARHKLNRVTDTLEPETNFDHAAAVIDAVLNDLPDHAAIGTAEFHRLIGKYLHDRHPDQRGILKTAYERAVPVYVPAFVDSELGNDVYTHNLRRQYDGRGPVWINPQFDQSLLVERAKNAKKMGIFSVGGGVPRNHIQNIAPLLEIANGRVPEADLPTRAFSYGVRIAPDGYSIGNLSGCSYNENTSWRKFHPDARKAEIRADATFVWPFLVKYVMETRTA